MHGRPYSIHMRCNLTTGGVGLALLNKILESIPNYVMDQAPLKNGAIDLLFCSHRMHVPKKVSLTSFT